MLSDPYRPPAAAVVQPEPRERRLYSLNQIALATFIGSAACGCFLLAQNLAALGRTEARWRTFAGGALATLVQIGTLMLLPRIPGVSVGVNIAALVLVRSIAQDLLGDELQARLERGAPAQSTWWALLISVLFLIAYWIVTLLAAVVAILWLRQA